ncbi:acetate--CoA ligase family protein [Streptomyces indonesiensis]
MNRRGAGLASLAGIAGISTFVSAGNRADVSGNDLLQYWYDDPLTDVVLMYLESIGNPRKFTRLARRTAAVKPVVVVKGARHTGSAPTGHAVPTTRIPDATVSDLLRQAGVIRVDTVTELADTGVLLASQPLPAGPRVAILGNSESLGLITYDACLTEELRPLPPRDLTTDATPDDFRRALTEALADDTCDAVIVTAIPWVGDGSAQALAAAVREAAQTPGPGPAKPVAVVHLEIQELAQALAGTGAEPAPGTRRIPAYPAAERAVRALAEAVRYARWREESAEPGRVPEYDDIDEAGAAADIQVLLAPADGHGGGGHGGDGTGGGTVDGAGPGVELSAADTQRLLARYGVSVLPALPAPDPDAAVRAAERLGFPVALKPTAPHLRHRADLGGVRLELGSETELRRAYAELTDYLGRPEELGLVVQRMAPRGVDTVVRAAIDPAAGAVLSFGLAGAPSELLGDTAHGLVPVTGRDAAELIRSIRTAPLLFGWRGSKPVDTVALEELLLRVSRLVDDHPEMVAVDLEPVVVAQHGLSVLGASARLAPPPPRTDLGPRHMPAY